MNSQTSDDAAFQHGITLFNAHEFFQAHEVWEDVWRATPGPEKGILQSLIQIAVALHHHSTGNRDGAQSVMDRALRNLEEAGDFFRDINMVRLREDVARTAQALKSKQEIRFFELTRR